MEESSYRLTLIPGPKSPGKDNDVYLRPMIEDRKIASILQIRQRYVDNDKDPKVSTTSELFALAYGPTWTPISINSCVVDGVTYVVHSRDECRTTQNSGICSPGPDEEIYYDGQSMEVDVPPDIIDVVDQDDDITDDEDTLPHDLADTDDEDLINVDDDGVEKVTRTWNPPMDRDIAASRSIAKAYNTNKAAFKAQHWVIDPTTGIYNVDKIRRARPEDITAEEWDKYIQFWNDPRNIARAAQNRQTGKEPVIFDRIPVACSPSR
ncbi:hypothetical protein Tco_0121697 [Tanacetum coccineum]